MIVAWFILLMLISKDVNSLSCVSNEAKKDFDDSRTALKEMEDHLRNTTKNLEESFKKITALLQDQVGVVKDALSNVGEKIKKVDDDFQLLGKDLENITYWIGLTDLIEGEFRWSFDQSRATFLPWVNGYGTASSNYNCVSMNNRGKAEWYYTSCKSMRHYICESNFYF